MTVCKVRWLQLISEMQGRGAELSGETPGASVYRLFWAILGSEKSDSHPVQRLKNETNRDFIMGQEYLEVARWKLFEILF